VSLSSRTTRDSNVIAQDQPRHSMQQSKVGPTSHAGYSRTAKLAKPCGSLVSDDDSEDRDTSPISLPTWHSRGCQVRSRLRSFAEWGPPKPSLPYRSAAGVFKNLWNQFYTHLCRKAEEVPLRNFSVPYWESLTWHSMDNLSFKSPDILSTQCRGTHETFIVKVQVIFERWKLMSGSCCDIQNQIPFQIPPFKQG
jgi:hypothetical protein